MFHSTLCTSMSIWCSEIRKDREVYKMCLMAHLRKRKSEDNAYSCSCFIIIPVSKGHQTEQTITLFCLKKILEMLSFSLDEGKHCFQIHFTF